MGFKVGNQVIYNGKRCFVSSVAGNNTERCYIVGYKSDGQIRAFLAQEHELELAPCEGHLNGRCDYSTNYSEFACEFCQLASEGVKFEDVKR